MLPKVLPLVLKRRAAAFDNPDWLYELKTLPYSQRKMCGSRSVRWFKIENRAYSQADDGRGELLNGDMRTLAKLRKGRPNLRGSIQPETSKNPNSTSRAATRNSRRRSHDSGVAPSTPDP